jgi:hypothetical protein
VGWESSAHKSKASWWSRGEGKHSNKFDIGDKEGSEGGNEGGLEGACEKAGGR